MLVAHEFPSKFAVRDVANGFFMFTSRGALSAIVLQIKPGLPTHTGFRITQAPLLLGSRFSYRHAELTHQYFEHVRKLEVSRTVWFARASGRSFSTGSLSLLLWRPQASDEDQEIVFDEFLRLRAACSESQTYSTRIGVSATPAGHCGAQSSGFESYGYCFEIECNCEKNGQP